MQRTLRKDELAKDDFVEIWLYTCRVWGPAQAERYLDALEAGVMLIGRNPTSGKRRDEIKPGYWSKPIKHHVVFYTFNDAEVRVRRVLHETMDFGAHLPE